MNRFSKEFDIIRFENLGKRRVKLLTRGCFSGKILRSIMTEIFGFNHDYIVKSSRNKLLKTTSFTVQMCSLEKPINYEDEEKNKKVL